MTAVPGSGIAIGLLLPDVLGTYADRGNATNGILVLANDENNGRVVVGEDGTESFEAHFDQVELERMEKGLEFGRRVMEAAGAKKVAWTGPASTHVQGTCRMGSDPARSVVDSNCANRGWFSLEPNVF